MAVKPTVSPTWATDTDFSSGPASGNPTKVNPTGWPTVAQGFVPGNGIIAEFVNTILSNLYEWTGWLLAGSSAGAEDAHIVETDDTGLAVLARLTTVTSAIINNPQIRWRIDTTTLGNASEVVTLENDIWVISGTLTANREYTLDDVGTPEGAALLIKREAAGNFTASLISGIGGATIATMPNDGSTQFVYAVYDGSDWVAVSWSDGVTV